MRRRPSLVLFACCLLALAIPLGAVADEHEEEPEAPDTCWLVDAEDPDSTELCREDAWFAPAETPVGNLAAFDLSGFPTWTDEEPTASVTDGAGGGYFGSPVVDILFPTSPEAGVTFDGTRTGPFDTVKVTLHAFLPGRAALGSSSHGFTTELVVDGEPLIFPGSDPHEVEVREVGDGVYEMELAYTDLLADLERWVGTGPDVEHTIRLNISPFFFGDEAVYVYGTAEVPGGLVFNAFDEELTGILTLRP